MRSESSTTRPPSTHLNLACLLLLFTIAAAAGRVSAAAVLESFLTDPVAGGRFVQQTTGTQTSFLHDPSRQRLNATLDVDNASAFYLSGAFTPLTEYDSFSFSARFRVEAFDDRVPPTAFLGLMTTRHVADFGSGLTVVLATSQSRIVAAAAIDDPNDSGVNVGGDEIALQSGADYVAYARYSPATRSLTADIFGGTDFVQHMGRSVAILPAGRSFRVDRIGLQNGGARQTDSDTGSLTLAVDDLAIPGRPPVSVSLGDLTLTEGTGGEVNAIFPVRLSLPADLPVEIDFRTTDGDAVAGEDYRALAGTLTVPAGATTALIAVPVIPDRVGEPAESFRLLLTAARNATLARAEATATLLDDDEPSISLTGAELPEGRSGETTGQVLVTLSNPSTRQITVRYTTADGTAIAGTDFKSATGTLVFPPGTTSQSITLAVLGDTVAEGNESLVLRLSNPVNGRLGTAAVDITLLDDDPPPILSATDIQFAEADALSVQATFTLQLSGPSARPVTVSYATADGTARAGTDYLAATGTITFSPGEVTRVVGVRVLGDLLPEPDETFDLTLAAAIGAALGNTRAVATLIDDDRIPTLTVADVTAAEGASGQSTPLVFEVRLSQPATDAVTVNFSTVTGTATADVDFIPAAGTLRFPAGTTVQTVTVTLVGDGANEPNETVLVRLNSPLNATLARAEATGTILNDDGLILSINDTTVAEGDASTVQAVFTVTLTGTPTQPLSVGYSTRDLTATAGLDYAAASGTLTFLPGQTIRTISIPITGDLQDEADETFEINLGTASGATLARSQGLGTITDDDPPSIHINSVSLPEGSSGATIARFEVTLSTPPAREVRVNYATTERTATEGRDYLPALGTLVFPPGTTRQTIDVTVLGDAIDETDEIFAVELSAAQGGVLAVAIGLGTIKDDDEAPRISLEDTQVTECTGASGELRFNVVLSAPSERPVSATFSTADGSAVGGADFQSTRGTVTFPPGSVRQTLVVPIACDSTDEPAEFLTVFLGNPSNGFIGDGEARGTIIDDDPPELSILDLTIREGNTGAVNALVELRLTSALTDALVVDFATADGTATAGADYAAVSGTVTLPPGALSQTIAVPVLGDTLPEGDESFRLVIRNAAGVRVGRTEAIGIISEDDLPALVTTGATVVEPDDGTVTALVTLKLAAPSLAPVTVSYTMLPDTATLSADFVRRSATITFAPGEVEKQIEISVIGDRLVEGDEFFLVNIYAATNATIENALARVVIVDNDGVITIAAADQVVTEGNAGPQACVFELRLSAPSARTVTVAYATVNGSAAAGADFFPATGTVTFQPGIVSQTVRVSVLGDLLFEGDEDFFLALRNPENAALERPQIRAVIKDDDLRPVISIDDATVTEGAAGQRTNAVFRVRLNPTSGQTVTVDYLVLDDAAVADEDFDSSSGTLTFAPGVAEQRITVPVFGDAVPEEDETFLVRLNGLQNALPGREEGIGTILNDDGIALRLQSASVRESDTGEVPVEFTVSLARPVSGTVTVRYETVDGTARAGDDYVPAAGTLTFPPGLTSQKLVVLARGDLEDEPDETFLVRLRDAVNAVAPSDPATGTILDNDPPAFVIDDVTVLGSRAGSVEARFTVTLTSPSSETVTVQFTTANGSATAGTDFSEASGTLTFPPGQVRQELPIQVKGNTLDEADETFLVNLSRPVNATLRDPQGIGTILNERAPNTPPALGAIPRQILLEDTPGPLVPFSVSDLESPATDLKLTLSSSNLTLLPASGLQLSGTGADRFLRLAPAPDQFGDTQLTLILSDPAGLSASALIPVSVLPVNDPPSLAPIQDLDLSEDAPEQVILLRNVSPGPPNESGQSLRFTVESSRPGLIPNPRLEYTSPSSAGRLLLQPAPDASGSALILVRLHDDGGTANGGRDFTELTFNVRVAPVNDPPLLSRIPDLSTPANTRTPPIPFTVSDKETAAELLLVTVQSDNLSLLPQSGLALAGRASDRTLTLQPAPGLSGSATVTLTVADADGGSARTTFRLTVLPLPEISVAPVTLTEGDQGSVDALFEVTLRGPSPLPVSLRYATEDLSAIAGADYSPVSGTLQFDPLTTPPAAAPALRGLLSGNQLRLSWPAPADPWELHESTRIGSQASWTRLPTPVSNDASGPFVVLTLSDTPRFFRLVLPGGSASTVNRRQIRVPVLGDLLVEPTESFRLRLSDPVNAVLSTPTAEAAILDNDALPALSIADASAMEDAPSGTLSFAVQLSRPYPQPVTVRYDTLDGSATAGADYLALGGTLTFAPGQTLLSLPVRLLDDSIPEPVETFALRLSLPANATLARADATGTITDNDTVANQPPVVRLTSPENDDRFPAGTSIVLTADASDPDGSVALVEFFANNQPLGSTTRAPFSFTWPDVLQGAYNLTARATDNRGATALSQPVAITVRPDDGRKRVAIVQNFPAPEISRLQAWLTDLDLSSRVFSQEGLSFDALKAYDLVLWDDLGTLDSGLSANDVAVFQQVFAAGIPLYFIGDDLARSSASLPASLQPVWTSLTHLKPATGELAAAEVRITEGRHPVTNGPFGSVGDFRLGTDYDRTTLTGTGEQLLGTTDAGPVLLAQEEGASQNRSVTQNLLAAEGRGLYASIQREKLFKNAVWWLLKLPPPPPFLNLNLSVTAEPEAPVVGREFTLTAVVQHGGESEATGIALVFVLPDGVTHLGTDTENDSECLLEDGAVICRLGRLSRSASTTVTVRLRADRPGDLTISANVSPNQPEALTDDNGVEIELNIGN